MFRGKESSNRIELSRLLQDLLNFGVLGSLQLWGWGCGWLGGAPTHRHTHAHAHMCMHTHAHTHMHARTHTHGKHDNFMQMAAPIGESLGIPYDVIHACVRVHVHACTCICTWVGCTLSPPPRIIQNSIALELIEIFQFCLKI